ncbi:MFS transporter [Brevibacillus sp. H7]|uniref:MFS transporter n=1 Tax=Brevibacillus sp. H7 TaxID=3349138 RepID=UPI0038172CCD
MWPKGKASKILFGLAVAAFLGPFTQTVYTPSLQAIGHDFQASAFLVNLTISLFTLILAASQFLVGPLADTKGRRATLLPGLILFVTGSLICFFSSSISMFLAGRVIQALGISTGSVVAAAVIGDIYPLNERGQAMSTYQSMVFLGPVLGPVIGSFLSAFFDWQWLFLVLAIAGLLVFGYNRTVLPETLREGIVPVKITPATFAAIVRHRSAFAILFLGFFQFYGYYVFLVFLPQLLTDLFQIPLAVKGLFFVPLTAGIVLGTYLGGKWQRVWSHQRILSFSSIAIGAAVFLFWMMLQMHALSIPALIAFLLAYGVLLGSSLPAQSTLLISLFQREKATAMGVYNFVRFTGASLGPLAGSLLHAWAGDRLLYASLGCLLLAAAWFIRKNVGDMSNDPA